MNGHCFGNTGMASKQTTPTNQLHDVAPDRSAGESIEIEISHKNMKEAGSLLTQKQELGAYRGLW